MKKHLVRCLVPWCRNYCVQGHLFKTEWKPATSLKLKVLRLMYRHAIYEICPIHQRFGPIYWEDVA